MVSSIRAIKMQDIITDIAAGPFGSNLKVSCFVDQGVPIIDGANLKGIKVTDNVTKFVTYEKAESLYRSIAIRGDIVVTISGNVGQIAYVPYDSLYEKYLVSQRQFRLTINSLEAYVPYIVYYFHTPEGQHKILSFVNQTGVPALAQPLKNFKNIEIDLPDLETQKRIAKVLSALDDKIELNNKINKNLEEQAKSIYSKMFIESRPADYANGTLNEIADITMGQSPVGSSYNEEGLGEIFFQGRAEFGERFPTIRLYTTEPKRMAFANDTLISVRAPVGDLNVAHEYCCIGRGLAAIHSKTNHQSFLLYTMFSLKRQLEVFNGEGTVFGSINRDSLRNIAIYIPSIDKINDFENLVAPIDLEIRNNYDQICALQQIRDKLLPKLMSGEIDVDNVAI